MNAEHAKQILARMLRIRTIEEGIAARYADQQMRCPTHLSTGQEAVPGVIGELLNTDDRVVSTHRSHGHYLAKGGGLNAMIAELHGRATGCSGGHGGSMHLIDESVGFMGSTAIVGNSIPIGAGLGLALQLDNESSQQSDKNSTAIGVIFLGDGAIEEGVFYETANFAAVRQLPVLFCCENNGYSVYSSLPPRQPQGRAIHHLAAAMGLCSRHTTDTHIGNLYQALRDAICDIRAGGGPGFIEIDTYRWREHCGPNDDDHLGYRPSGELHQHQQADPLVRFQSELLSEGLIDASWIENQQRSHQQQLDVAFNFALASAWPQQKPLDELQASQVYSDAVLIEESRLPWHDY